MLKITPMYEAMVGSYGRSFFDVIAQDMKELELFFETAKGVLDRVVLNEDELAEAKLKRIPEAKFEIAKTFIQRYNMTAKGLKQVVEKKEFLDHFALEAVTAIIYGTDFYPREMSVEQYAGVVMAAREEFGDSTLFEQRIINVAGVVNHVQMKAVAIQIELFTALFNVPFEDELDVDVETD